MAMKRNCPQAQEDTALDEVRKKLVVLLFSFLRNITLAHQGIFNSADIVSIPVVGEYTPLVKQLKYQ
eukprot:25621-Ditylum_brightwellii.AAC.1